jgi:hypothetical protein
VAPGHVGLAGLAARAGPPGKHDHVDLLTDRGVLRLTDPRRFGAVVWSPALDQAPAARLLAGLGPSPSTSASPRPTSTTPCSSAAARSSRPCWPATSWWAPATSTPATPCSRRASTRARPAIASGRCGRPGCWRRSAECWARPLPPAAPRCATSRMPMAAWASTRARPGSMAGRGGLPALRGHHPAHRPGPAGHLLLPGCQRR